jgi:hypothetical protein
MDGLLVRNNELKQTALQRQGSHPIFGRMNCASFTILPGKVQRSYFQMICEKTTLCGALCFAGC